MTNYNVTSKVVEGSKNTIGSSIATYLNTVDDTKVIRAILLQRTGADNFIAVIIHDA